MSNVTHILRGTFDQAPLIVTKTGNGQYQVNNAIGTRLVQIETDKGNMVIVTTNGYRKIHIYSVEELWFAASNNLRAVKIEPIPTREDSAVGVIVEKSGVVRSVGKNKVMEAIGSNRLPDELKIQGVKGGTLVTVRPTHNLTRSTSMSTSSALVHRDVHQLAM